MLQLIVSIVIILCYWVITRMHNTAKFDFERNCRKIKFTQLPQNKIREKKQLQFAVKFECGSQYAASEWM